MSRNQLGTLYEQMGMGNSSSDPHLGPNSYLYYRQMLPEDVRAAVDGKFHLDSLPGEPLTYDDFLRLPDEQLEAVMSEMHGAQGREFSSEVRRQVFEIIRRHHEELSRAEKTELETEIRQLVSNPEQVVRLERDYRVMTEDLRLRKFIEDDFQIHLADYDVRTQANFISFLKDANPRTIQRVQDFGRRSGSEAVEAFLALEYGDEFGVSLLTVAEQAPAEEAKEIISGLASVRELAADLRREYADFDEAFAGQVEQAWVRRTTQLLLDAEQLAVGGQPSAELYNGESVTILSLSEVIWGLGAVKEAMAAELRGLREGGGEVIRSDSSTTTVRMPDGSLRQFRPYAASEADGTEDPIHHFDNEARANALYPDGDFLPQERRDHPSRQRALSIRFDREGMWRQASGEPWLDRQGKLVNEPAGVHGWVSLDIGSIFGEPDDPNVRLGRLLAVGEAQYAKRRGQHPNFNHVREVFDSKFGQAEEFARLVKYLQERSLRQASSTETLAA